MLAVAGVGRDDERRVVPRTCPLFNQVYLVAVEEAITVDYGRAGVVFDIPECYLYINQALPIKNLIPHLS